MKRKLILVSNRLPVHLGRSTDGLYTYEKNAGGLTTGIESLLLRGELLEALGVGQVVWVGGASFSASVWTKAARLTDGLPYRICPVFLPKAIEDRYYNGFSNNTLWPLLHSFPMFTEMEPDWFEQYKVANAKFAREVLAIAEPDDLIWVHDFHLMQLPHLLRQRLPNTPIGFFLHVPFPDYSVFRILPRAWQTVLLDGMLGADLIGFHTHEYAQHFIGSTRRLLGSEEELNWLYTRDQMAQVGVFPMGVDFEKFDALSRQPEAYREASFIRENFNDRKIIFSVDRNDYTKGTLNRLVVLEAFLKKYPEWHEKVVLMLIVAPSREINRRYSERRRMIDEAVSRLNGKWGSLTWQPVIYHNKKYAQEDLVALFRAANVGLVTPLRDGMNLVAKEFVAARSDEQGVLMLSELAGASIDLADALPVNPYDHDDMVTKLHAALTMPDEEQQRRMRNLRHIVARHDVVDWAQSFLLALGEAAEKRRRFDPQPFDAPTAEAVHERYRDADRRLLLLDYDGTLAPFCDDPAESRPTPGLLNLLARLSADPQNSIVIISGRDNEMLENWFGQLPIWLVAEHGFKVRQPGQDWHAFERAPVTWKATVRPLMQFFADRCPGAFIEEKDYALAWHYRAADEEAGFRSSRLLVEQLEGVQPELRVLVLDGNKVVEVKQIERHKGMIAAQLAAEQPFDFVLALGDDKTDEYMFGSLNAETAFTIKVGKAPSRARWYLRQQKEALELLNDLVGSEATLLR